MAVEVTGRYGGNLSMELTHGPSATVIRTAAPVDNQGDGSSFSPTDLVAGALGACMVTMMAIVGERDGIELGGMSFRLAKHMQADPRRIAAVPVVIHMPAGLSADQRRKLERTARSCPVRLSLRPELETAVEFVYPD